MSNTRKICFSGITMALYIAVMYVSQGFAFGQYQVRIATALYALAFPLPFLVLPLALANSISNMVMGGLGVFDIVGGFIVGIITAGAIWLVQRFKLPMFFVVPIIILGPALVVPFWLSYLLGVPYLALVGSLGVGQLTPAVVGFVMIKFLDTHLKGMKKDD
ncbi:MAG: QueT transporter family protein [Defluviitaleaceae bacterium]|nr:QueT transporter family protein [Defluviitaleaceae bacterium]